MVHHRQSLLNQINRILQFLKQPEAAVQNKVSYVHILQNKNDNETSTPTVDDKEEEKEFHSFIHSARARESELETARRKIMGGEIGKGVLMLSDDELADLFSRLSLAEFERYAVIVADCELSGKKYRKKIRKKG